LGAVLRELAAGLIGGLGKRRRAFVDPLSTGIGAVCQERGSASGIGGHDALTLPMEAIS
jgi:hypothetical protein